MRRLVIILLLLLSFEAGAAQVRVSAAASLTDALRAIAASYEQRTGDRIVLNFGASSTLARQIEEGAPADLFLSADELKMDALQQRGLIVVPTRVTLLSNTLIVVVPKQGGVRIASANDLASARIRRIALAEPSSVPAGIYAKEWLTKSGVWDRVAAKVVPTDNVRAALAAVESGNVDAAIVYRTDANNNEHVRIALEVPHDGGPRIRYPAALLTEAAEPEAAKRFLAYLRSKGASAVFRKHGFILP